MVSIRKIKAGRIFDVFNYIFLGILTLVFLIPFWVVFVTSFVGEAERLSRGMFILFPWKIDFYTYSVLLRKNSQIFTGYMATLSRVFLGTFFNILVTSMLAYGLSKRKLPFRNLITFAIFFTTLFNGGLVPTFLMVKFTGIYNTLLALIIPNLVVVWWMLLLRNFFMQIPDSMEESASLDGASLLTIFFKIMLPLSLPAIATIGLFYAVWHWNSWFDGMLYIQNMKMLPLQNILRNIILASSTENVTELSTAAPPPLETVKSATIVISTVPILFAYPFIQKYFVKGIMVGGIKG